MATRPLRIAWLGPGPGEDGGVAGALTELLDGLTSLGHRIDCFLPGGERPLPARIAQEPNLTFIWGTSRWRWDRWYSRTKMTAFASGLATRAIALLRLRREVVRRHEREPYDLIYQFSTIENLAVPSRLARTVPLVIHPETHVAGELRWLIRERRVSRRCEPAYRFAAVAAIMAVRALVQRAGIRRASLLICISSVFRDHLVRDYGFDERNTIVTANPVRLERFEPRRGPAGDPPTVLVLGRIAVRKGVDDVVAVARALLDENVPARIRVVGGPSLWSDYTRLLEDLPSANAEYAGAVPASEVPLELASSDLLLQASRYEPFALTVAEALAAGVPVVATSEVGAIENVDRKVAAEVAPGDVGAMASAIVEVLGRLQQDPQEVRATAHAEARRLFAPEVVCGQISAALERLVRDVPGDAGADRPGDRNPVTA